MPRVTLGNRAYERINRILNLFGAETVNHIDLDAAFPTHDLNPIVQASQVGFWELYVEDATGAGNVIVTVSPWAGAGWDQIVNPQGRTIATPGNADMPDPEDDVYLIGAVPSADTTNVTNFQVGISNANGVSGTHVRPITSVLDVATTITGLAVSYMANGEPYYMAPLPLKLHTQGVRDEFWVRIAFGGAATTQTVFYLMTAPKGIIPVALAGPHGT